MSLTPDFHNKNDKPKGAADRDAVLKVNCDEVILSALQRNTLKYFFHSDSGADLDVDLTESNF